MDLATHALAGMAVGAAATRLWWHGLPVHDPETRAGMPVPPIPPLLPILATGVIASVLPDVDVLLWPIDLNLYYEWHRLFTHTLLAAPVIAAVAAAAGIVIGAGPPIRPRMGGFTGFFISPGDNQTTFSETREPTHFLRRRGKWVGHGTLLATALVAVVLHLSLDLLCDWPLRLLWPISNRDFALAIINYSHPAFTLGFAALALALLYPLGRRPLNGDSHLFWGQNR